MDEFEEDSDYKEVSPISGEKNKDNNIMENSSDENEEH